MTHIILQCKKCAYISADRCDSKSQYKRLLAQGGVLCPKCESKKFTIKDTADAQPPHAYNNAWIARQWQRDNKC